MTGSTSTTCSPSTVSTMRNTPWGAGCCGPTLTLTSIVSSSRSWGTRNSVVMGVPYPSVNAGASSRSRPPAYPPDAMPHPSGCGVGESTRWPCLTPPQPEGWAIAQIQCPAFQGGVLHRQPQPLALLLRGQRLQRLRHGQALLLRREPLRPRLLAGLLDHGRLLLGQRDLGGAVVGGFGRRFRRGRGLCGGGRLLLERLDGRLHGRLLLVSGEPLRPRL